MIYYVISYYGIVNILNIELVVNCVDRNDFFLCFLIVVDEIDFIKSFYCYLNIDCIKSLKNVM